MLGSEKIKELKARSHHLEPVVWIGKSGLTNKVIEEIKKQLKKKRLIKVKMLKQSLEGKNKKELAQEIAQKTGSVVVHQVGFAAVLYREKNEEKAAKSI